MKKLYLSRADKKVFGLLGGLGEYFEVDSTLLRIAYLFVLIFTGFVPGIIFYLIASLVVPKKPAI
jgi:phage shock protein PspC (stress-responsive transcriptional regulator)